MDVCYVKLRVRSAYRRYGTSRRFTRVANIEVGSGWASHLAWSRWTPVEDGACASKRSYDGPLLTVVEATLAFVSSSGSLSIVAVKSTESSTIQQTVTVSGAQILDEGDQRSITCLRWLDVRHSRLAGRETDPQNLLVWSKAATIHMSIAENKDGYRWSGVRTVRLERVGGWASANALGATVGEIEIDPRCGM